MLLMLSIRVDVVVDAVYASCFDVHKLAAHGGDGGVHIK